MKTAKQASCTYWFNAAYNCYGLMHKVSDSVLSMSLLRAHAVFSAAGFKGRGNPCLKTREILNRRFDLCECDLVCSNTDLHANGQGFDSGFYIRNTTGSFCVMDQFCAACIAAFFLCHGYSKLCLFRLLHCVCAQFQGWLRLKRMLMLHHHIDPDHVNRL